MGDRVVWDKKTHELGVENFYGTLITDYHDYHGGYLNFGYWETTDNYMVAAKELVNKVGTLAQLDNKSKVLDVACGMAPQCVQLHKNYGSEIVGLDVTWPHVEIARRRIEKEKLQHKITIQHGSATKMPFEDTSFTHIISIEGGAHFNTREDFFKESARVLKKGGVMTISDYAIKRPPKKLWEKLVIKAAIKLWHGHKENAYGKEVFKEKLKQAGFTNIKYLEVGKHVIPGYYQEQLKKESIQGVRRVRGWFAAYPGLIIDYVMNKAFTTGLLEYVFVRAEKTK